MHRDDRNRRRRWHGRPRGNAPGRDRQDHGRSGGTNQPPQGEPSVAVSGVLQLSESGHGFLRQAVNNYNPAPSDPVVPADLARERVLQTGLEVGGLAIPDPRPGRGAWLARIEAINGTPAESHGPVTPFKDLVAEDPTERIRLELVAERDLDPRRRPDRADRQGAALPHRRPAQGRQDGAAAEDRPLDHRRTTPRSTSSCCWSTSGPRR